MPSGSAVARKLAMVVGSDVAQPQEISSVTRRLADGSRLVSHAMASGLTFLSEESSGNTFREIAAAASARAEEGAMEATKAAAPMGSFAATPLRTPAAPLLRLRPERFS